MGSLSEPRRTIEIEWASGDYVYIPSHDDSAKPSGGTTKGKLVGAPAGASAKNDPLKGTGSIGSISLRVADPNGGFTSEIHSELTTGNGLRHRRIRCYVGERGDSWSSYSVAWTARAVSISWDGAAYTISANDIQRTEKTRVCRARVVNLRETISATATQIPYSGAASDFIAVEHDSQWGDRPDETVLYVRLGDEAICCSGTSVDASLGQVFDVVQRGALGTVAVTHEADLSQAENRRPEIREFIYLDLAAPKAAYALLTGILHGQSGATLPDHWHLGIDTDWVKLSDFTGVGTDLWDTGDDSGYMFRAEGIKETDGKKLVESVLRGWGVQRVYPDGRVGVRRIESVLSDATPTRTLDTSNVTGKGTLKNDGGQVANIAAIEWDWDWREEKYRRTRVLADAGSMGTHGQAPLYKMQLRGAHPARHTDGVLFSITNAIRSRYAGPPVVISGVQVLASEGVTPGEIVRYNMPGVPDINEGTVDIDRSFEVLGVNYGDVTDSLTLFGSSAAAGAIAPQDDGHQIDDDEYNTGSSLGSRTDIDGTYHVLGDATIDRRITVNGTSVLWVRGHLHLADDCNLDGIGRGHAGGIGGQPGTAGIGQTASGGSVLSVIEPHYDDETFQTTTRSHREYLGRHVGAGNSVAVPEPALEVVNGALQGLPSDLSGTGGHGGPESGLRWHLTGTATLEDGGDGGDGGAGLIIICRGFSAASGARINLSGDSGSAGTSSEGCYSGHGAPGHPGGLLIIIDGGYSRPNPLEFFTAETGAPVTTGTALGVGGVGNGNAGSNYRSRHTSDEVADLRASMHLVRYAPSSGEITPPTASNQTQPQVTGLVAGLRLSTRVATGGARYASQYIDWDAASAQANTLAGYELQMMIGDSSWRALGTAGPESSGVPVEMQEGVIHLLRVRALSALGADYHGPWSDTVEVTPAITIGGIPVPGPNMLADPRFLDADRHAWLRGSVNSPRLATGGDGSSPCVQMVADGNWGHHIETRADYAVKPGERYQLGARYRVVSGLTGSGFYGFARFLDASGAELAAEAQFSYYPDTGSAAAYRDADLILEVPSNPAIVAMRAGWNINADNSSGEVRIDSLELQRIVGTLDIDADAVTRYAYVETAGPLVWEPLSGGGALQYADGGDVLMPNDGGEVLVTLEFTADLTVASGSVSAQFGIFSVPDAGVNWIVAKGGGIDTPHLGTAELVPGVQSFTWRRFYQPSTNPISLGDRYYQATIKGGAGIDITDVLLIVQRFSR